MRKLKTASFNLMIGGDNIKADSVIAEDKAHPTLIEAANTGRKINGVRLATWLPGEAPAKPEEPKSEPEPEPISDPEPVAGPSLTDIILTLVAEGDNKSAIIAELGKTEEWTQAAVRAEFDRLMEDGKIASSKPGEYRVV